MRLSIILLINKKEPTAMVSSLMFGRYVHLAEDIPNKAIIPFSTPSVNTIQHSYAQYLATIYRSPIRCELIGFIVPEYHQSKYKVTGINSTTPRTVRQSNWNMLEKGNLITALVYTMRERAAVH